MKPCPATASYSFRACFFFFFFFFLNFFCRSFSIKSWTLQNVVCVTGTRFWRYTWIRVSSSMYMASIRISFVLFKWWTNTPESQPLPLPYSCYLCMYGSCIHFLPRLHRGCVPDIWSFFFLFFLPKTLYLFLFFVFFYFERTTPAAYLLRACKPCIFFFFLFFISRLMDL